MSAETDLLPLPELPRQVEGYNSDYWEAGQIEEYAADYARANVAHATAALQAEVEALRAEVVKLRNLRADAIHECALANIHAELMAEALEEIRSRSSMNLAMQPDPFELTARLGDIYQIADAALAKENSND